MYKMLQYQSFRIGMFWWKNYKLTAIQTIVEISQLTKLNLLIDKRRYLAQERNVFRKFFERILLCQEHPLMYW